MQRHDRRATALIALDGSLHFISWLVLAALLASVALKCSEMLFLSVWWNFRRGRSVAGDFHRRLMEEGYASASDVPRAHGYEPYRWSDCFLFFVPSRLRRYVFAWQTLCASSAILYWYIPQPEIRIPFYWAANLLIFSALLHRLTARLFLGVADNVKLHASVQRDHRFNKSVVTGRVATTLLTDVVTSVVAFAFIYCGLDVENQAMFTPPGTPMTLAEAFYFSFVTQTTTGYGDIFPSHPWAYLNVVFQMTFVWVLVAVVAFHYGVTLSEITEQHLYKAQSSTRHRHTADSLSTTSIASPPERVFSLFVDARMIRCTGIGRHIVGLLRELSGRHHALFVGVSTSADAQRVRQEAPGATIVAEGLPRYYCPGEHIEIWRVCRRVARREALDAYWFPQYNAPFFLPEPSLVTVHDLIQFKYSTGLTRTLLVPCAKRTLRRVTNRASAVLCVSAATKRKLLRCNPHLSDKLHVVPNGVDDRWGEPFSPKDRREFLVSRGLRRYVLAVGVKKRHKNHALNRPGFSGDCFT